MVKEVIEQIAKVLVDNPDDVQVTEIKGEQTTVFELRVHPADLDKVAGRQGRTARAIRTILSSAGMKAKKRFVCAGNSGTMSKNFPTELSLLVPALSVLGATIKRAAC